MLSGMSKHLATVSAQWTAIWHSLRQYWLDDSPPTHCSRQCSSSSRAAALDLQPTLCTCTFWLSGWLTVNTVLLNVNAIHQTWQAHISTLAHGRQDGSNGGDSIRDARMQGYNIRLLSINSHWSTQSESRVMREITRIIARNAVRINLHKQLIGALISTQLYWFKSTERQLNISLMHYGSELFIFHGVKKYKSLG